RSGTWRLYVNGENVDVTSSGSAPNGPGGAFRVGAIPQGTAGFFNGAVDDVKVWESALTDDEIRAEYRAG
ncbi:MAG: LamG domain-containing protein, partial [Actinomycetota bacterium]|nr:LamG domain-containing protein [Actinomycetota bacterium]